jgi:hypothetical protein
MKMTEVASVRISQRNLQRLGNLRRRLHLAPLPVWHLCYLIVLRKPTRSHGHQTDWMFDYDGYNQRLYTDIHLGHWVLRRALIIFDS